MRRGAVCSAEILQGGGGGGGGGGELGVFKKKF